MEIAALVVLLWLGGNTAFVLLRYRATADRRRTPAGGQSAGAATTVVADLGTPAVPLVVAVPTQPAPRQDVRARAGR